MQNIFLKIDKKILIILGIILVVVLIAGFFIYKYSKDVEKTVQNNQEEEIIKTPRQGQEQPPVNLGNPQIEIQPQPGLTVCADRCGDGICQPANTICDDNLNCICAETKADCPGDCK
mgnify:CR=1 FL=1